MNELRRGQCRVQTTSSSRAWYRLWWLAGSLAGCSGGAADRPDTTAPKDSGVAAVTAPAQRATVLLVGTSLTAGYGLDPSQAVGDAAARVGSTRSGCRFRW
ncbi:MAG: hypothetical protein V9E87_08865 [Gemmatimonadales bacterium]